MERLLIAGADSVVGANLAAALSDRYSVTAATFSRPVSIVDCETASVRETVEEDIRRLLAFEQPDRLIYCGAAAHSTWEPDETGRPGSRTVAAAARWATAARDFGCRLTLLSSDAVFTGPWMFHDEDSASFCPSLPAQIVRTTEQRVTGIVPECLLVRTNAYGWSPFDDGPGWVEETISALQADPPTTFDPLRHASPLPATDLAEILHRAFCEELQGVYHVGGAERVSPARFAENLSDEFDLPAPLPRRMGSVAGRPVGFGCGETSLHTRKIRKALCVAMPTLAEGLRRLHNQQRTGFCDRFCDSGEPVLEEVA